MPWDEASGVKLRSWLGVDDAQFYDPNLIALLPMDFYSPGKGTSGDLPPRKDFAGRSTGRELMQLILTPPSSQFTSRAIGRAGCGPC